MRDRPTSPCSAQSGPTGSEAVVEGQKGLRESVVPLTTIGRALEHDDTGAGSASGRYPVRSKEQTAGDRCAHAPQTDKRGLPFPTDPFVFHLVGPDRLELSTNGLRVPPATLSRFAQVVVNVE